jgi:RNA:NAD 2'-phosphotransferase (TPT1/KptA family)
MVGSDGRRLSKFLSLVLRHKADNFGLSLNAAGYADLEAVWDVIRTRFHGQVTQADVKTKCLQRSGPAR